MTRPSIPFLDLTSSLDRVRSDLDAAWKTVLGHGKFVDGPEVARFEEEFATFCSAEACVGVGNGTDAIELVLRAIGVGPGDDVIVPANTFVATAEAVTAVGARPVFADVDPATLLIRPEDVRRAMTPTARALIAVHLYGQPCDMHALAAVAHECNLVLIEDAAQAHGATYEDSTPAAHSIAATYSFYPGKNLGALGDGGAVVTNDRALADDVRQISMHGRSADHRYHHDVVGRNSRLDTIQAAVLSERLRWLDDENSRRAEVFQRYCDALPSSVRLVEQAPRRTSSFHLIVALVDQRDDFRASLAEAGIATGLHYPVPCHWQRAYDHLEVPSLPVVERAAARLVSLPVWGHMSDADVDHVCDRIAWLRG